jgi:hypothetical protein
MEAFSIASAVVSVVLGAFAIWLSIVFYRMSVESSNRIQEASKDLSSSVNKLEKLFEHLYSDTFSMMRDTYSDMRKHMWPEHTDQESEMIAQIETRANREIDNIRKELLQQIGAVAAQTGGTDAKVDELRVEIAPLIDEAISRSRHVDAEAREETLRDVMLHQASAAGDRGVSLIDLYDFVEKKNEGWEEQLEHELDNLIEEGLLWVRSYTNGRVVQDTKNMQAGDTVYYVSKPTRGGP